MSSQQRQNCIRLHRRSCRPPAADQNEAGTAPLVCLSLQIAPNQSGAWWLPLRALAVILGTLVPEDGMANATSCALGTVALAQWDISCGVTVSGQLDRMSFGMVIHGHSGQLGE